MATEKYNLIISEDLKLILKEFESESLVAQLLLQGSHDIETLVENPINYLSTSKDGVNISYLTQDRISLLNPSAYWSTTKRFLTRPGVIVKKIFNNVSSREVEKFSNLFRSQVTKPNFEFKIVSGEDIRRYYYWETYADGCGTLGNSCMKHSGCRDFFDIYVENKNISMLGMFNSDNKLMGRALLWNINSYKIMDRIYTINDEILAFYFKKWATDNGYFHKSEQNWYNTIQFEQMGQKKQELKLELKLAKNRYPRYPYVDTFKFIDLEKGIIYNYIPDIVNKSLFRTLTAADGSGHDYNFLKFDSIDRVYRHRGESVPVNYGPYKNIFTHCNNVVFSESNNQYILSKDSKYNEGACDHIFNEENNQYNNQDNIEKRKEAIKIHIESQKKKQEEKKKRIAEGATQGVTDQIDGLFQEVSDGGYYQGLQPKHKKIRINTEIPTQQDQPIVYVNLNLENSNNIEQPTEIRENRRMEFWGDYQIPLLDYFIDGAEPEAAPEAAPEAVSEAPPDEPPVESVEQTEISERQVIVNYPE